MAISGEDQRLVTQPSTVIAGYSQRGRPSPTGSDGIQLLAAPLSRVGSGITDGNGASEMYGCFDLESMAAFVGGRHLVHLTVGISYKCPVARVMLFLSMLSTA
jgi:hypothetical protein